MQSHDSIFHRSYLHGKLQTHDTSYRNKPNDYGRVAFGHLTQFIRIFIYFNFYCWKFVLFHKCYLHQEKTQCVYYAYAKSVIAIVLNFSLHDILQSRISKSRGSSVFVLFPSMELARQLATRIATTFSGESIFCSNIDFAIVSGVASESCSRRRCSFKKRVLTSDKSSAVRRRTVNRSILETGSKEDAAGGQCCVFRIDPRSLPRQHPSPRVDTEFLQQSWR